MGTTVQALLPHDDSSMFDFVVARLRRLEQLWSRFNPESDISRIARAEGLPTTVDGDTIMLIERLVTAHHVTRGLFDPTILPALLAAGYTESRVGVASSVLPTSAHTGTPHDIRIHHASNEVTLPRGMTLDAGGLGKGFAADLVARDLVDMGVLGASISVGGDVALAGRPDDADNWVVTVGAPRDYSTTIATVRTRGGGVATSTLAAREWQVDGEHRHHVIDPRTGRPVEPSDHSTLQATVVAGSAADAEAFATALTVCSPDEGHELIDHYDLAALIVLHDGEMREPGAWKSFL